MTMDASQQSVASFPRILFFLSFIWWQFSNTHPPYSSSHLSCVLISVRMKKEKRLEKNQPMSHFNMYLQSTFPCYSVYCITLNRLLTAQCERWHNWFRGTPCYSTYGESIWYSPQWLLCQSPFEGVLNRKGTIMSPSVTGGHQPDRPDSEEEEGDCERAGRLYESYLAQLLYGLLLCHRESRTTYIQCISLPEERSCLRHYSPWCESRMYRIRLWLGVA